MLGRRTGLEPGVRFWDALEFLVIKLSLIVSGYSVPNRVSRLAATLLRSPDVLRHSRALPLSDRAIIGTLLFECEPMGRPWPSTMTSALP